MLDVPILKHFRVCPYKKPNKVIVAIFQSHFRTSLSVSIFPLYTPNLHDTRGRTYVMITYVSKENNLGPDDKIRYIWGLKGLIVIL